LEILFISRFQPQDIVLETKLKPFIPEYVPAIGDIDAFLKVYMIYLKSKNKRLFEFNKGTST
jgi:Intraflagellar transport complex B protein 46 C terminal